MGADETSRIVYAKRRIHKAPREALRGQGFDPENRASATITKGENSNGKATYEHMRYYELSFHD